MSRIISGQFKGHGLVLPKVKSTRPTSERFKESLFSVLLARLPEAVFLDAFAGSGQIGLEALSRGAAKAFFVEPKQQARVALQRNIKALGLDETRAQLMPMTLERAIKSFRGTDQRFDLIYLDPPWKWDKPFRHLGNALGKGELLKPDTIVVTESEASKETPFDEIAVAIGFDPIFDREYGSARLKIYARRDAL